MESPLARLRGRGWLAGLPLAFLVVVLLASYWPHLGHSTDDAFITYRYARNLARGDGLVFNRGERWLGTTAPGLAMVLGGAAFLTGPAAIPVTSGLLAVLALAVAALVLSRFTAPAGRMASTVTALGLLLASSRWLLEVLGHEGFLVAALAASALWALEASRPRLAGALWAVAIFVRPDSAVMAAAAGLQEWRRARRFPRTLAATGGVGVLAGALAVLATAGTIVPASLQVKLAEATEPGLATRSGFWLRLAAWCWRDWGVGGPVLVCLSLAGWVILYRARPGPAGRVLLPTALLLAFYPAVGVNFAPWYLIVPVICLLLGVAAAVAAAWASTRTWLRVAVVAVAIGAVAPQLLWLAGTRGQAPDFRLPQMLEAATWLDQHADPEAPVAAVEVGFLGFYCDRPIVDLMGLGSPGALDALVGNCLPDYFLQRGPAFFVHNDAFNYLLAPLLSDPRFRERYEVAAVLPTPSWYVNRFQVWARREPSGGGSSATGRSRR